MLCACKYRSGHSLWRDAGRGEVQAAALLGRWPSTRFDTLFLGPAPSQLRCPVAGGWTRSGSHQEVWIRAQSTTATITYPQRLQYRFTAFHRHRHP
eukprot:365346-Chlamydomonas_euryale.AAC.11